VSTSFKEYGRDWVLRPIMEQLIVDVKQIRQTHLIGLGSRSYGSLARKHLADSGRLGVLGSGCLTRDILPWFAKKKMGIRIFCRDMEKAKGLKEEFPFIELSALDSHQVFKKEALIVAAPVGAAWFKEWVDRRIKGLQKVLDLRGECAEDPLPIQTPVVDLSAFFSQIEQNRQQTKLAIKSAREEIDRILAQHYQSVCHRPFGWDDLLCV